MLLVLARFGCGTGIALAGIGEAGGEGSCCLRRASLPVGLVGEGGGVLSREEEEKTLKRLDLTSACEGVCCGVGS